MTLYAGIGQHQALDGREAGLQATHLALNRLGSNTVNLGLVIFPYQYDAQQIIQGVTSLLGNAPIIGMSTAAGISGSSVQSNSVIVALLGGSNFHAETHWLADYAQSGRSSASRLSQLAQYEQRPASALLFFADGFNGDAEQFCGEFSGIQLPIIGGLSIGDLYSGSSFQIVGSQTGSGGLAAALLRGAVKIGIGYGHGWKPVGTHFRVTRSRGFWLRTLNGRPSSEIYSQWFGYPPRDWAFPPLNHLVRLYPLGLEQGDGEGLLIRSPLRVEADGSFRMNTTIRDGADAYLMVASPTTCREAAGQAARQALDSLGNTRPVFGLVLADLSWKLLHEAQPGAEIAAVQEVLGTDIPLAGAYTLGQVVPDNSGTPKFLNQHMVVILFAEDVES